MKYAFLFLLGMLIVSGCAEKKEKEMNEDSAIVTKHVTYNAGGTTLKGYLAYDSSIKGKMPGVIVVHEWWGMNGYAEHRAEMLAELGYVAFALDMYGEGKTADHPEDAQKFAMAVMSKMDTARLRFNAAIKILKEQPETDTSQIGAIGYCFGGGVVLRMALEGADLKGVVSFHGDLPTGPVKDPENVKARILVCNGAVDQFNPKEKVEEFEKNMKEAGIDSKVINYPDAMHSFTNPAADSLGKKFSIPIGYNKAADEKSWIDMQAFFCDVFNFNP